MPAAHESAGQGCQFLLSRSLPRRPANPPSQLSACARPSLSGVLAPGALALALPSSLPESPPPTGGPQKEDFSTKPWVTWSLL